MITIIVETLETIRQELNRYSFTIAFNDTTSKKFDSQVIVRLNSVSTTK